MSTQLPDRPKPRESNVDVLIIGAGPAGVMAGVWMARSGINARIVDKRGSRILCGQADGIAPRTGEIFDSMGVIQHFGPDEKYSSDSFCSWVPASDGSGDIIRANAADPAKMTMGFSKKEFFTTHQGSVENAHRQVMREYGLEVEQGVLPVALEVKQDGDKQSKYPVVVTLQHLTPDEAPPYQSRSHSRDDNGQLPSDDVFKSHVQYDDVEALRQKTRGRQETAEVVHAKYVIGCEGAHSWVRRQIGHEMRGSGTEALYGVLDVVPVTNFPDMRSVTTVQSRHGSLLIIPRERNMVRLYVPQEGHIKGEINPQTILEATRKILAPYTVDYTYCDWWTVYQVGQRVGSGYHDASHRVFLAGDAVHTHSPKEGQGMNTSIGDTHNLGWKLAGVLNGELDPRVLHTYEMERRPLAKRLINFDRKMTAAYAAKEQNLIHQLLTANIYFMRGGGILYPESPLTAKASVPVDLSARLPDTSDVAEFEDGVYQELVLTNAVQAKSQMAPGIEIGLRPETHTVWNHASGQNKEMHDLLRGDGKWRLVVFAGDLGIPDQLDRVNRLGEWLGASGGLLSRFVSKRAARAGHQHSFQNPSLIEVVLIHAGYCLSFNVTDLHSTYVPLDSRLGYDYSRVWAESRHSSSTSGQIYAGYGVDRARGCVAIFRPDQHASYLGDIEDIASIEQFFAGFMLS